MKDWNTLIEFNWQPILWLNYFCIWKLSFRLGFFSQVLFSSLVLPFLNPICNIRSMLRRIWCSHWLLHSVEYEIHQGAYVVVAFHFIAFFFWNDNDFFSLSSHPTKYLVVDSSLCTNTYSLGGRWLTCCTAQENTTVFFPFLHFGVVFISNQIESESHRLKIL